MPITFGSIISGTMQTNPGTGVVLVTTGDLPPGQYFFRFIIAPSSNTIYNIELLDAADSVVQTMVVRAAANNTLNLPLVGTLTIPINYEMRIRPRTAIGGGNTTVAAIELNKI